MDEQSGCARGVTPAADAVRVHYLKSEGTFRPGRNCGKLDKWQRLTELMCSARRSFKRKSSSARMLSSQSVCRARYLVASVLMKCTATHPRILWNTQRLSKTGLSENIPITPARC